MSTPQSLPRIFISMHYLELGGAETGLIGLLEALSPERVEVDLFVHSHRGPLMRHIPAWVNLLPESRRYRTLEAPLPTVVGRGHLDIAAARLLAKADCRRYLAAHPEVAPSAIYGFLGRRLNPLLPSMSRRRAYDLAISYMRPHDYLLSHVDAKRRIGWVHTDYCVDPAASDVEAPVWRALDHIATLSEANAEAFARWMPGVSEKLCIIDNALPVAMIRERSLNGDAPELVPGGFNILSVGRLCAQKNFTMVPELMRRLISLSGRRDLRWFIIGDGAPAERRLIERAIADSGVASNVILLGARENPYPYLRRCSLYVQPSAVEGRSVAVREAQTLGRPVVITAYPSASAQIVDGEEGLIVPLDPEGAAREMAALLSEPSRLDAFAAVNASRDFSGRESTAESIYSLLTSPYAAS